MLFTGLKDVLRTFDEHGWKGSFTRGFWQIGNGGYDCWFELYYKSLPVARCVAGELECNVPWVSDSEKVKLFSKILDVYDHLKVRNLEDELRQDLASSDEVREKQCASLDDVIRSCEEVSKNVAASGEKRSGKEDRPVERDF